jgi:heat shock protein HtpX
MVGTLAIIIGLSTLVFGVILTLFSTFDLVTLGILVVAFNVGQWLISPYLIGAIYHTRELSEAENPKLHEIVAELSKKSGIKKPRLMLAQVPMPNAFAYGSPITGNRVAVTDGILKTLNPGEIEAVLGHELGHLRHRDVQAMMLVSLLPALFTYVGYSLMLSGGTVGRQKNQGSNAAVLGIAFMAFSWVLTMFTLYLSRLREYYADRHSASIVEGGSQKLSTGLAKIVQASRNMGRFRGRKQNLSGFKALFITDPDRAEVDSAEISAMASSGDERLVQEILSNRLTTMDRVMEVFSTHPNIIKRLKALQELA